MASEVITAPAVRDRAGLAADLARATEARPSSTFATTVAHAGACTLAIVAPFELTRPLVQLPHQSISNLEAIVFAAVGSWLVAAVWLRQWPIVRSAITTPWLMLLAAMALSAAAAPTARLNALHMTGRSAVALAVFTMTINGTTTPARLRRTIVAMLGAGALVGALAILEYLQVRVVLDWLKAFRPGIAVVGAQLRAGGPLQYPTIASMYLEIVLALGLGLFMTTLAGRGRGRSAAVWVALAVIAAGIVLTFTRAGLATMAVSVALVGLWRIRHRGLDRGVAAIALVPILVAALLFVSRPTQSVWLRLTSEGQDDWYRSAITAPAEVALPTGGIRNVPITITNTGRLTWDSQENPPFYLSYHWLEPGADRVVSFEGVRTPFPAPVRPGEHVTIEARVRAPRAPGRYRLGWDVVQEGRLWFSTEPGGTLTFSRATVAGALANGAFTTSPLPLPAVRPGRLVLWKAAGRMLAAHPLLGIGPDNFRLLYGAYAGIADADVRVHSNNMYLEVLVGCGLVGAVPLAWLLWRIARNVAANARTAASDAAMAPAIGIAAAMIAIAVHGLVDSFVAFTPTYVLIALTLGLSQAAARDANGSMTSNPSNTGNHAHRI